MTARVNAPEGAWRSVITDEKGNGPGDGEPVWLEFNLSYVLKDEFITWCEKNNIKQPKLITHWVIEDDYSFAEPELEFPSTEDAIFFRLLWEGDAPISDS